MSIVNLVLLCIYITYLLSVLFKLYNSDYSTKRQLLIDWVIPFKDWVVPICKKLIKEFNHLK